LSTGSDGALTEKPADAVHPHGSLRIACGSNSSEHVVWSFKKEGSTDKQEIASGGVVQPSFSELFAIDESTNKSHLIATTTNDIELYCGEYECVDNDGGMATATVSMH